MHARRLEEYALQQQNAHKPQVAPEPEIHDDDIIEGRHFKNQINTLKQELNQFKQQQYSSTIEMQLRNRYNDFDRVVTHENISKLRELRPEIANSLHQTPDLYNKAAATYTLLKELGIYQENTYNPERERADLNYNKPRSTTSLQKPESPLSHVKEFSGSKLTEARKKEIWKQMQQNII
jgi:hypothetical protein